MSLMLMNLLKPILFVVALLVSASATADERSDPEQHFSDAELEQLLAPIALYPDSVLSHILIAATYPLEVIAAERWTQQNPELEASEAVEAVKDMDWDPSVRALVAFPSILKRMSEDLDWMEQLGDAFLQDESRMLASIQSLRESAYEAGSLDQLENYSVSRDEEAIVIEPAEREVVYIPYYDSRVVYGPGYWSHYRPTYWDCPWHDHHYASHGPGPFYWGPRRHLSFGFFFSSFHWGNSHIVRIPYYHYRPHLAYSHFQILRHHHSRRWYHKPRRHRGYGYREGYRANGYYQDRRHHDGKGVRDTRRVSRSVHRSPATNSVRTGPYPSRNAYPTERGNSRVINRPVVSVPSRPQSASVPSNRTVVAPSKPVQARPATRIPKTVQQAEARPQSTQTRRSTPSSRPQRGNSRFHPR